jgi:hypothetical protein
MAPQLRHPVSGDTIGALWAAFAPADHAMTMSAPDLNAA